MTFSSEDFFFLLFKRKQKKLDLNYFTWSSLGPRDYERPLTLSKASHAVQTLPSLPLEKPEGRMGFLFSLNSMANSDLTWTHLVSKPDLTLCEVIYSPCLSYIVRIFMCFPVEIICLCCSETCLGTSMLSACTRWDMSEDSHTVHM